jgi:hypothetical protein
LQNIPFTFISGHVANLKIQIPWSKIVSESITIVSDIRYDFFDKIKTMLPCITDDKHIGACCTIKRFCCELTSSSEKEIEEENFNG